MPEPVHDHQDGRMRQARRNLDAVALPKGVELCSSLKRNRQFALSARLFALVLLLSLGIESVVTLILSGRVAWLSTGWAAVVLALLMGVAFFIAVYLLIVRPLVRESLSLRAAEESLVAERAALTAELAEERRALERTEGEYRQLVDSADVIILRWDTSGRIIFINEYGERFFGYGRGELLGRGVLDSIVPRTDSLTGRDLEDLIANLVEHPRDFSRNENENLRADGTRVWISWTNTALYNDRNEPVEILSVGVDVTQRRVYEDALALVEAESRSILESAGEGIYGVDATGRATFVNLAAAQMLGYTPVELIGQSVHNLIHHHYPDGTPYPVESCPTYRAYTGKDAGAAVSKSEVFWRKDGTPISVEFTSTPMVMNGAVSGAVVTFRDVTERDRIQRELRRSEARIRTVLETVADGIVTIDQHGHIQSFNRAAEQMFGYRREEVLGEDVGLLMPDELSAVPRAGIQAYLNTGLSRILGTSREVTARRKSGELFPIDISLAETSIDDMRAFTGVIRDISRRKAVDESLRSLSRAVEASPVSVVITTIDGTIEYVNPKFEEVTGFRREEAVGANPRVLKSGELDRGFYARMWETLQRGDEWHGEFHNRRKDGTFFWERASISPIRDENGQITHYVAVKEDITEQRRVADQLRVAKEAAEAANQAKSTFLANMSHEIRTPLNAIVGYSQLLGRMPLEDKQHEYLDTIVRSSEHLLAIINDILDMARIESGHMIVSPEDFDVNQLLHDLGNMFLLRAREKGISLEIGRLDEAACRLNADEGKLRQILINLIGNATKFTEKGGVWVAPRLHHVEGEACRLEVVVRDSGPGIPAEDLEGLFDAFVQTATGRTTQGGTGLGLAISRKLARAMGGDITAASQVGTGSTFTLSVSVGEMEGATLEHRVHREKVLRVVAPGQRYRILVADDVRENRNLIVEQLGPLGFDVFEAANGQEVLEKFQEYDPHMVLMDMGMPVMDGYEATRRLKETEAGRGVPVIALTARVLSENRDGVLAAGVDDFLGKPFHDYEILEMVEKHLGVQFLRDSDSAHAIQAANAGADLGGAIAGLPSDLRAALREAVRAGRIKVIGELMGQVAGLDSALAQTLQRMVDDFQYRKLLQLLEQQGIPDGS